MGTTLLNNLIIKINLIVIDLMFDVQYLIFDNLLILLLITIVLHQVV